MAASGKERQGAAGGVSAGRQLPLFAAHVWEMADIQVDQVAPNGVTAKLHWIARRPDGSVLWEDRPGYMVVDDGNGWLIRGNISSNS